MQDTVQPTEQHAAEQGLVPAVNAACRILEALAQPASSGATLTELSRELELSKSSVHGLLRTLQSWGYVQRESQSRRFRLGAALVSMGRAAAGQVRAAALVGERLPALAGEHHLTFALAQLTDSGDAQVIDRAYPTDAIHVGITLGARYGAFDGAIGKCLLAAMESHAAERLACESTIPRHTARTIVDPQALLAEIAQVRELGWAASLGELKPNQAVAAPLFDAHGDLELILFAVGFPGELPAASIPNIGVLLREVTHAVEVALGGCPPMTRGISEMTQDAKENM